MASRFSNKLVARRRRAGRLKTISWIAALFHAEATGELAFRGNWVMPQLRHVPLKERNRAPKLGLG